MGLFDKQIELSIMWMDGQKIRTDGVTVDRPGTRKHLPPTPKGGDITTWEDSDGGHNEQKRRDMSVSSDCDFELCVPLYKTLFQDPFY